jgi:hypothetical protein
MNRQQERTVRERSEGLVSTQNPGSAPTAALFFTDPGPEVQSPQLWPHGDASKTHVTSFTKHLHWARGFPRGPATIVDTID